MYHNPQGCVVIEYTVLIKSKLGLKLAYEEVEEDTQAEPKKGRQLDVTLHRPDGRHLVFGMPQGRGVLDRQVKVTGHIFTQGAVIRDHHGNNALYEFPPFITQMPVPPVDWCFGNPEQGGLQDGIPLDETGVDE